MFRGDDHQNCDGFFVHAADVQVNELGTLGYGSGANGTPISGADVSRMLQGVP